MSAGWAGGLHAVPGTPRGSDPVNLGVTYAGVESNPGTVRNDGNGTASVHKPGAPSSPSGTRSHQQQPDTSDELEIVVLTNPCRKGRRAVTDRQIYKLILAAIAEGRATVVDAESLDPTNVKFQIGDDITVFVCCERQSLQIRTRYDHRAIGMRRRARKVIEALQQTGWVDAMHDDPWVELAERMRRD